MIEALLNQNVWMYVMVLVGCAGIIGRVIMNGYLRGLIKETDHMGRTRRRTLAEIRQRYEDTESLDSAVNDVGSFVDKYIDRMKLCGFSLSAWNGFIKNTFVLVGATGIFSALYQYYVLNAGDEAVRLLAGGGAMLALMLVTWIQCDAAKSERTLADCIKNYLGNSLGNRLRKEGRKQAAAAEIYGSGTVRGEDAVAEKRETVYGALSVVADIDDGERTTDAEADGERSVGRKKLRKTENGKSGDGGFATETPGCGEGLAGAGIRDSGKYEAAAAEASGYGERSAGAGIRDSDEYDALLDTMMQRILAQG